MKFLSYDEARKIVHSMKLKSREDWKRYIKLDIKRPDIPSDPSRSYKEEWTVIILAAVLIINVIHQAIFI